MFRQQVVLVATVGKVVLAAEVDMVDMVIIVLSAVLAT